MNIGNIGPKYLFSLNAQPMKWHVVLSELCDNSFDAGASRIEITFGPGRQLTVSDDGGGCDDIQRMLTLGDHYRHSTTKLGRWGVGLKEAACWLWGEMKILSRCKGIARNARIDWAVLAKQQDWNVPDPIETEDDGIGTVLVFRGISRQFPEYAHIQTELGYTFAPALWAGKQIMMRFPRRKPIVCAGWQMPDIEEMVQDRFEINRKRVKFTAGIVIVGASNPRPGFSITHGHRIIMNTAFGSKGISVARICGIIELDAAWILSKNKTEVVDSDQDALEDAVYERCHGILEKAAQQAEILRNTALEDKVSDFLRSALKTRKEKRDPPENSTGTVAPKHTERKRRKAKKTQVGENILDKVDLGRIRMEWQTRADTQLGRVDLAGNVIYLNEAHQRLAHHRRMENADALVDVCLTLLSFEVIESEQKDRFPFSREYDNFVGALSFILHSQQLTDESLRHPNETTA